MVTLLASMSFAKDGNKTKIFRDVDDMTDEVSYMTSESITLKNGRKALNIFAGLIENENGVNPFSLAVIHKRLGSCSEKDLFIILLENGVKIKSKSWNDFNCKGYSYFNFTSREWAELGKSPIKKIMFKNGRSYETISQKVDVSDKNYFITMIELLKKKQFTKRK